MSPVSLNYGNLLQPRLGSDAAKALDPERLAPGGELDARFQAALERVREGRRSGELGFLDLPDDQRLARQVQEVADSFGQWFHTLVVVGIGGSSLGGRAIAEALLDRHWNEASDEARDHFPRLHFLENADPDSTAALLRQVDLRGALFNVVSKSGGTAETMAQYLIIEDRLREALGDEGVRGHLLFTTDPERGALRRLALEREIPALPVPQNVGGRFSVLSPVGLLPAATTGVDVGELLAGAAEMRARCLRDDLRRNPAGLLSVLLHAADTELDCPVHVFMPYSDRLRALALWFQQLWGESLGKAPTAGPTPLAALGAVDQHSLLQLLMEGPRDKVVIFVRVGRRDEPLELPATHAEHPELAYLGGHTLDELLDTELRATTEALRRRGRPSLTLQVERLDARSLGGLFMLLQVTTVMAGAHYGVDPLNQPGVELGKVLTSGLLGREGVEPPEMAADDEKWTV